VRRRWAAAAVAAAAVFALAAPAGAFVGQVRTLVILGTWGPQPFSQAAAQRVVFDESAAWLARSSFGRLTMSGDTTPWLTVARPAACDRGVVSRTFRAAAERAGYAPASYTRIVYLVPGLGCPYQGYGSGNEAYLMNSLSRTLVVHELGHTFGLGHAKSRECRGSRCELREYGDRYDTMGSGRGDFNAFEKFTLGWLDTAPRVAADGVYTIEAIERASTGPQALVVETADTEYWFDHREPEWDDESFRAGLPADNVFVRAGPPSSNPVAGGPFSEPNVLVPAVPYGRQAYVTGERFVDAQAFEVTVVGRTGTSVQVAFRWTDRTPPSRPRFLTPGTTVRGRGALAVTWRPSVETGSGLARYEVSLDGRPAVQVAVDFRIGERARLARPARGRHVLRLVAIDRAGNRSAAAVRRFVVR
jgi:hypothetical protein